MPLMPKRVKYRKVQKGSRKGIARSGTRLSFGEYGLKALGRGWVKSVQIEACRVAINRHMKRKGKLWIRIYPDKPVSKKPIETRMGKGKGAPDHWVAVVKPGMMLFEIAGVPDMIARESLRLADAKLGIPTRLICRD
jgi:large subunit ribosomal protein L16